MSLPLRTAFACAALCLALAACKRGEEAKPAADSTAETPAFVPGLVPPPPPDAGPQDVLVTSDKMVVGITYPTGLAPYPGLITVITDYAKARQAELQSEVDGLGNDRPGVPYDLTLSFQKLAESPELVAVAADGDLYTGGAHGQPLVMRYVWLVRQNRLLTAKDLITTPAGWAAVSANAREQLKLAAQQRADEDESATPEERQQLLQGDAKAIDEGAAGKPENFQHFEPLLDMQKKVRALRFVFPPYQIGPYAYGVQSVDVPAALLRQHVAPEYRELFSP